MNASSHFKAKDTVFHERQPYAVNKATSYYFSRHADIVLVIDLFIDETKKHESYCPRISAKVSRLWAKEEYIYNNDGDAALQNWLNTIQKKEQTWAAV